MENVIGLLRIHVIRGIKLAIRDVSKSSDPYIIVKLGKQKLKTRVVKKNLNPEWKEELTLTIQDSSAPVTLHVYDWDKFSQDDKMGDAEFEIGPMIEAVKKSTENIPDGTVITNLIPNRQNCLSDESKIVWDKGKFTQNMFIRLRNVECGEVELRLEWINIHGSKHQRASTSG